MKAVFVELPAFARHRERYLDEEAFRTLQEELARNPQAGVVLRNTGGLRKLRFGDPRRGKGKRGGLRVIYFWWEAGRQFWLFTVFDKDEVADLTATQCNALEALLEEELRRRNRP